MKKEKKRNSILEQLEEERKRVENIGMIVSILICIVILGVAIAEWVGKVNINDSLYISCVIIYFLNYMLVEFFCYVKIEEKICNERGTLKVVNIKDIAAKGNLKGFVTIKDEKIVNSILCNNIEKVEFQETDAGCIANICLKNGYCLCSEEFPKEEFLALISKVVRENFLDCLIETIKVQNIERKAMKLIISGENFFYENDQITDEELLEMFELKEE